MGGSSRDEKAVAMVIGDKGLESTVAPASIYLQQFIEFLMFNMVEVCVFALLRTCVSVPGLPRYERMRETPLVDILLFSPHSLQDLHSGKSLPL